MGSVSDAPKVAEDDWYRAEEIFSLVNPAALKQPFQTYNW
jgi:hypothetical protein